MRPRTSPSGTVASSCNPICWEKARSENTSAMDIPNIRIGISFFVLVFVTIDKSTFLSATSHHRPQRKAESRSGPNFINRMPIGDRMPKSQIERKIIAYLPDQAHQARNRGRLIDFLLVEDFSNRAYDPLGRA